uniref:Uncharacterized protein n=1 Tax=Branchiostoma floridae TaxID=7739 RepID=C3ZGQ1_BRAFL|eukprot:XP_002592266.1 hypothetical protein BRAFLDRAFT_70997 [Branchiostoma floridae]
MAPTKDENFKGKYRFVRRDGELLHGEAAEEESANVFAEEVMKEIKDKQREKNRLLRLKHPAFNTETPRDVYQDTDGVLTRRARRDTTKEGSGEKERKTSKKRNTSARAVRKRVLSVKKSGASTEVDDQAKAYATGLNVAALTADADLTSLTFSPQATAAATGLEANVLTAQASGDTVEVDVQAKAEAKGAEVVAGNVDVRAVDEHVFVGAEAVVTGADVKVGNASVAGVKVDKRAGVTFEGKALEVKAFNVDAAGKGGGAAATVRAGGGAGSFDNSGTDKGSSSDRTRKIGATSNEIEGSLTLGGSGGDGTGLAAAVRVVEGNIGYLNVHENDKKVSLAGSGNTEVGGSETTGTIGQSDGRPRKDCISRTPTLRHIGASAGISVRQQRDGQTNGNERHQGGALAKYEDLSSYELQQRHKPFELPAITVKHSRSKHGGNRLNEETNCDADAKGFGTQKPQHRLDSDHTKQSQTTTKGKRTQTSTLPTGNQNQGEPRSTTTLSRGPPSSSRHTHLNRRRTPVRRAPGNDERKRISKSAAKGNQETSSVRSKLPPLTFNDRVLNKVASQAAPQTSQPSRPRSRKSSASKFRRSTGKLCVTDCFGNTRHPQVQKRGRSSTFNGTLLLERGHASLYGEGHSSGNGTRSDGPSSPSIPSFHGNLIDEAANKEGFDKFVEDWKTKTNYCHCCGMRGSSFTA